MAKNVWGLEDLDMSRIWRDIQTHRWAALVYLVYWILTLATIVITWNQGIPGAVVALVLTNPLIAGALVVWWRVATPEKAANPVERFRVGMLTGVLSTEITFLVMKGGAGAEVVGWMRGDKFQGIEVLEFAIAAAMFGVVLGFVGAAFAMAFDHLHHDHHKPIPSH
jgi:hypothetical protein